MVSVKVGQRWRYTGASYDFVIEIIEVPHIAKIVHVYRGRYKVGQSYTAYSILKDNSGETFKYIYLEGQDKP